MPAVATLQAELLGRDRKPSERTGQSAKRDRRLTQGKGDMPRMTLARGSSPLGRYGGRLLSQQGLGIQEQWDRAGTEPGTDGKGQGELPGLLAVSDGHCVGEGAARESWERSGKGAKERHRRGLRAQGRVPESELRGPSRDEPREAPQKGERSGDRPGPGVLGSSGRKGAATGRSCLHKRWVAGARWWGTRIPTWTAASSIKD